jgi:hypothetical protein
MRFTNCCTRTLNAPFRPRQIKRIARAEAEAGKIRALGEIEISEIQERALSRMIQQEGKRQENIERISALAIQDLRLDAKPEDVENNWLSHFFDKCRLVSDAEMQSLRGKVLAGEANQPGAFSRRTVELVSTLDKTDALLFTNLCKFGWLMGSLAPLIYDQTLPLYESEGITFGSLTHLDNIGLITFNNFTNFMRKDLPKKVIVSYYGRPVEIEFPDEAGNHLKVGKVLLTKVGEQLASICGSTPSDEFFDYVRATWEGYGYQLSLPPA